MGALMNPVALGRVMMAYGRARSMRFADRASMRAHQDRALRAFRRRVLSRSPYFSDYLSAPWEAWPLMDKAAMMRHFDQMNTAGLHLDDLWAFALRAEQSRDFSANWHGYSVGLSSGTSGRRAVFVASARERAQWAGTLLAKALVRPIAGHAAPPVGISEADRASTASSRGPRAAARRERVALFLRSGNSLYAAVRNPWLSFTFFDLFQPFESHWNALQALAPTLIVAPAQVLRALAQACLSGHLALPGARVISVAEVMGDDERQLVARAFGAPGEIYQATEGFLGVTCAHGHLHLNEAYLRVEREWLDDCRFVPIITDFTRRTQPIVRYRLDDVLRCTGRQCPCGDPSLVIDAIEGRCHDTLWLPANHGGRIRVFADVVERALAMALPRDVDYRVAQEGGDRLHLYVQGNEGDAMRARAGLEAALVRQDVDVPHLVWHVAHGPLPDDFMRKRRRVSRHPDGMETGLAPLTAARVAADKGGQ